MATEERQTNGLMERLRAETKALHDKAENQALQQALVKGELGRQTYARYLGQMLTVHLSLESAIRDLVAERPEFRDAIRDHTFREADLTADLEALGIDPAGCAPEQPTRELIADIERLSRDRPVALAGMHYVLEGANNGNRFIAQSMRGALELGGNRGATYLDPYGDAQRERWQAYKTAISQVPLGNGEADAIVEAAKRMFVAVSEISSEIACTAESPPAEPVPGVTPDSVGSSG